VHANESTVAAADQGNKRTAAHTQISQPQSTDKVGGDDNVRDCSTPDDLYYCSPEFLEQVDKLESMAIEKMEHRTAMGCSPPSFNIRI